MAQTEAKKTQKNKRNGKAGTIILVVVFLVGLALLLYPTVSNWWNLQVSSRAVATYNEAVAAMDEEDYTAYREAAKAYNEKVADIGSVSTLSSPELVDDDYWDLLDITGTGIMGYVTIEKINVRLPIYHGTDVGVLQIAAGHLEGTSLPIGGESTHCVISAHRGLPSALLFTNLDQMEVGDTFTLTVLNEVLTYQVDQITTVLPDELENLYIEDGKDYCTLMTCTPYGVNSHRLLVRGVRIETTDATINVTPEAYNLSITVVAAALAAILLTATLVTWLAVRRYRKKHGTNKHTTKKQ